MGSTGNTWVVPKCPPIGKETVSVDPVERLSVEFIYALPTQQQIALAVGVDGRDALARKPVFFREVLQRLTVVSPGTLPARSEPDVPMTVFSD